jgi:predicted Zn-dependent protease
MTGITLRRVGGLEIDLLWSDEERSLYTMHPETDVLAAMIDLAHAVNGRVRGQNLETYKSPYETYTHPDDQGLIKQAQESATRVQRKIRWRGIRQTLTVPVLILLVILGLNTPWFWPKPIIYPNGTIENTPSELASAKKLLPAEVILVPLNDIHFRFIAKIAQNTNEITGLKVRTLPPIRTPDVEPYAGRNQFDAIKVVNSLEDEIAAIRREHGNGMIVFFTTRDINQGDASTRFVYAHHDYRNRISVVSGARLARGIGMAYANRETVQNRFLKFVLRSIGEHHYALPRTSDSKSVMYSPIRSLIDVDAMGFLLDTDTGEVTQDRAGKK